MIILVWGFTKLLFNNIISCPWVQGQSLPVGRHSTFLQRRSKMQLQDLEKQIGKIPALIAAHLAGKINLSDIDLTFEEWYEVHNRSISGNELEALKVLALEKMVETARTTEQYWEAYYPNSESEFRTLTLEKMAEIASTFEQWWEVYEKSSSGSELKVLALKKITEIASTIEQWWEVYCSSSGSELKALALKKMGEFITG